MNHGALLGALLYLMPGLSLAAGVVPGTVATGGGAAVSTVTLPAFAIPAAGTGDAMIKVEVGTERATSAPSAVSSISWNGRAFALADSPTDAHPGAISVRVESGRTQYVAVYLLPMADRGVTADLIVQLNSSAAGIHVVASVLEGVSEVEATASSSLSGGAISSSIATMSPNAYVTDVINSGIATGYTPNAGQTQIFNVASLGQTTAVSDGVGPSAPGSVTLGWTGGASRLAHVVVAFSVAAPPPPPPPPDPGPCADAVPPEAYESFLNVKTAPHCGLVGDGVADDTAALQSCITYWSDHSRAIDPNTGDFTVAHESRDWLYMPCGTYKLTDQAAWVGAFPIGGEIGRAFTSIVGERAGCVKLKVPANTAAFSDPNAPKTLLQVGHGDTLAELSHVNLWNIDIEVGDGNFGLTGIDWPANNMVSMRNVRVLANPGQCRAGFTFGARIGPAMIKGIESVGCTYGVEVLPSYYSMTFEGVKVASNPGGGVRIGASVGQIKDLVSDQPSGSPAVRFVPIGNNAGSMWTFAGAQATGGAPGHAILIETPLGSNARLGKGYFRDFIVTEESDPGYMAFKRMRKSSPVEIIEDLPADFGTQPAMTMPVATGDPNYLPAPGPLRLEFPDFPSMVHPDPADWFIVEFPGVGVDAAPVIEAAAQDHKVIVLRDGYDIGSTIDLCGGAVERVIGFNQNFRQIAGTSVSPLISICPGSPILLEDLYARRDGGAFPEPRTRVQGPRHVSFRNVLHLFQLESQDADIDIENSCCDGVNVVGGKLVSRQLNVEDAYPPHDVRVENGSAVVLGYKGEGGDHGRQFQFVNSDAEVLGAFLHCSAQFTITHKPPFDFIDSRVGIYGGAGYSGCTWNEQARSYDDGIERLLTGAPPAEKNRGLAFPAFEHAL